MCLEFRIKFSVFCQKMSVTIIYNYLMLGLGEEFRKTMATRFYQDYL